MKLHIKNFGCQMNKLDSSLVTSALIDRGFELTDKAVDADVLLMNTCSVRAHAEERVMSHLGHLKRVKKSHPDLIVGVIGCMAQRLGEELLDHPAVDLVAGPANIARIPEMLEEVLKSKNKSIAITEKIRRKNPQTETDTLDKFELAHDSDENHIHGQAFVRVMRGCNNFCTYCIVPYVRGPEISRPPKDIIEQVRRLGEGGIKQTTLLGQTIDAYTYTEGGKTYKLADLLKMVSEVESIEWIRFITSHPGKFDISILQAMADLDKVTPYLHIPAQSGSDRILKAMNRKYTASQYIDLIEKARQILPDISIASDFIVGFPGETEEDFQATVELVKKARFKNSFVFKYSPRPGTDSANNLADDVGEEVKRQRNLDLLAIQNAISEKDSSKLLGRSVKVLVEGLSKKPHVNMTENGNNPQLIGRTATDHIVVFNGPETLTGTFTAIRIEKTSALTMFGKLE
ncbi:MAG: tRNA (N6-isopentenyl adenosine(37)-C2)-methylthiotransferase MiaB [Planctomycetes bacterium]|nr:tRNA (N6-isopentenyl adenosine(37)-C2)-methylthiotransferase MiaB [Planctomycetota bacterium]